MDITLIELSNIPAWFKNEKTQLRLNQLELLFLNIQVYFKAQHEELQQILLTIPENQAMSMNQFFQNQYLQQQPDNM